MSVDLAPAEPDTSIAQLRPYVSRLALDWALREPERRWREVEATFCFVDISGFTALSERLAKQGRVGAEELTIVLDTVFGELLSIAYEQGGSLVKFGGDALLLEFAGDRHPERACWAAIGMRAALRTVGRIDTDAGAVRLRMSVGLHTGTFHLFRVGSSHHELVVTGPAASMTTQMEGSADANEILVSPVTAAAVGDVFLQGPKGDGYVLRDRRSREPGPGPTPVDPAALVLAAGELPTALRTYLSAATTEPEHRLATVGFVKFTGTDALLGEHGPDAVAEALDQLVSAVQEIIDDEEVTFLSSDIDANGGKLILTAGVPVTREDDEGRMLRAARRIVETDLVLDVKVGVNRGHLFAGEIGTERRRTYTVIGDPVNLAARLMAAAPPGHVYATPSVLDRARSAFELTELEPFHVKGKSAPVTAYDVGPARTVDTSAVRVDWLPFTGRTRELDELGAIVDDVVRTGTGRTVELVGDVGSGKSRLVRELLDRTDGLRPVTIRAEPYWTTTPYLPVRLLLRELLPGRGSSPQALERRLRQAIEECAPQLDRWSTLLGEVVAIDLPDTPDVARLEPHYRGERRNAAGAELLVELVGDRVLFVAEDAHWLDQPTTDLLRQLSVLGAERGWLVLSTYRPPGSGDATVDSFELRPLSDEAIRSLIVATTDDDPLHDHEIDTLVERIDGNALFCHELLRALEHDRDLAQLPESLDAVSSARIDALDPQSRRLLRYASVLGTTFRLSALVELAGDEFDAVDDATIWTLSEFLVEDGVDTLRFRSRVLRDVAYEGLSYRRRRELHRRAGEALEQRYADRLDSYAELLARHFLGAGDHERAWRYAVRAADLSAETGAHTEAAAFYERALDVVRHLDVATDDVASVVERLAKSAERAGRYDTAVAALRRAEKLRADDPVAAATLVLDRVGLGQAAEQSGSLTRLVRRAYRLVDGIDDARATGVRMDALAWEAMIRRRQRRWREAEALAIRTSEEAEATGDWKVLATALTVLDTVYAETGRADDASFSERIIELRRQLGDRVGEGGALSNAGAVAYYTGDWGRAEALYEQASAALVDAGCLSLAAFVESNLGELLVHLGRYDEAEPRLTEAYRTLRAAGDQDGAGFAALQLGRLFVATGRFDDADRAFLEAHRLWEAIGDERGMLELRLHQAEAVLARGNIGLAATLLASVSPDQAAAEGMDWTYARLEALRLHRSGHVDAAADVIESALGSQEGGGPYERLRLLAGAATVLPSDRMEALGLRRELDVALAHFGVLGSGLDP